MKLLKQTNDEIRVLIQKDDSLASCVSLFFGLLDKNFISTKSTIAESTRISRIDEEEFIFVNQMGNRKTDYFYKDFHTDTVITNLLIHRINNSKIMVEISIETDKFQQSLMDSSNMTQFLNNFNLSLFKNHVKLPSKIIYETGIIIPRYNTTPDVDDDKKRKTTLNNCLTKISQIENDYLNIFPLTFLSNVCYNKQTKNMHFPITDFYKLINIGNLIQNTKPDVEQSSLKRLIEICNIFLKNNIIEKLKVDGFEFIKSRFSSTITIKLNNLILVSNRNLNQFMYMEHPGVILSTYVIEKLKLFEKIETKLSTSIITQI